MTKDEAFNRFGPATSIARLLGITRQAVYQWPDDLPQSIIDRLYGAELRAESTAEYQSSPSDPETTSKSGGDDVCPVGRTCGGRS